MTALRRLPKFTRLAADGSDVPVTYPGVWHHDTTTDPAHPCLVVWPDGAHLEVVRELAAPWKGPFKVLYVLVVPRGGSEPGRYESPWLWRDELEALLDRHARFLAEDGRHNIWVASPAEERQVVWDRHERLYAYGPLAEFESVLTRRGFRRGSGEIPVPHSHHYHAEFDDDERAILSAREWLRWPLLPRDE